MLGGRLADGHTYHLVVAERVVVLRLRLREGALGFGGQAVRGDQGVLGAGGAQSRVHAVLEELRDAHLTGSGGIDSRVVLGSCDSSGGSVSFAHD